MSEALADRNLLFGILALQMDFITRDQLVAGMHAWVLEKSKSLGQILVSLGALDPRFRDLLEPMVAAHVERHGGDPARSLAALSSVASALPPLSGVADAFGPGGRLAVGARSGFVHSWDLSEAPPTAASWDAHTEEVTGIAFSPDGQILYTCSSERTIKRWDVAGPRAAAPRQTHLFRSPEPLRSLALEATGRALAASGGGVVQLLDPGDLRRKAHTVAAGAGKVAFSPDGRTLAVDRGGLVELIAAEGNPVIDRLEDAHLGEASGAPLSRLDFSPDGSLLVTACSADDEHAIKLWDVASGRQVATVNVGGTDNLEASFSWNAHARCRPVAQLLRGWPPARLGFGRPDRPALASRGRPVGRADDLADVLGVGPDRPFRAGRQDPGGPRRRRAGRPDLAPRSTPPAARPLGTRLARLTLDSRRPTGDPGTLRPPRLQRVDRASP